jgi:nitrilase
MPGELHACLHRKESSWQRSLPSRCSAVERGPVYGEALVYAEIEAWMIKATKAIVDTMGHYARPDVLRLLVHGEQGWQPVGSVRDLSPIRLALTDEALTRAADARDVDPATVVELAEEVRRAAG